MYIPEGVPHHPEADSFDLRGSIQRVRDACRAYRAAFLATFLLTVTLAAAYLVLFPKNYVAEVLLVADAEKDPPRDNFYQLWNVFRSEQLTNEPELITSKAVLRRVVSDLNLGYDDVYHPFLSHAAYLWSESLVGRKYRAVKHFFFPGKKSPYEATPEQIALARTLDDFQAGAVLKPVPESSVGRLVVMGPTPRVAEIANRLADDYLQLRKERFVEEATRAYAALATEVEKAHDSLTALENKRREYAEENGLLLDFEKEKLDVNRSTELTNRIEEAEAQIAALQRKQQAVDKQLLSEPKDVTSIRVYQQNSVREKMRLTRFDLQASLDALKLRYRPDSPEVRELETRLSDLDRRIAAEDDKVEQSHSDTLNSLYEELHRGSILTASELKSLRAGLAVRKAQQAALQKNIMRIPEKVNALSGLIRDVKSEEQRYQVLTDRLMMARVSIAAANAAPPSMRVADYAAPPGEPAWPKVKVFVPAAVAVGLIAATLVALLLDLLQGRVTRSRLVQTRAGLPVYGTLQLAPSPILDILPRALVDDGESAAAEGSEPGFKTQR